MNHHLSDNFFIFSSFFSWTLGMLKQKLPYFTVLSVAHPNFALTHVLHYVLRLTIAIVLSITDDMKLLDVNGAEKKLTRSDVHWMMVTGWFTFIIAWILDIIYYKLHPSAVDFNPNRLRRKLSLFVLGQNIDITSIFGKYQLKTFYLIL